MERMMPAYIGNVVFPYPLKWLDKNRPRVLGSDTVTRSGNLVMLRAEGNGPTYLPARVLFEWTPFSAVTTLYAYWKSGGEWTADLEGTGDTCTVRFAAKNGVAKVKHQTGKDVVHAHWDGSENDVYSGEMNLIIVRT
ncbi:MAG: hypothetical protein RDU20_22845 [Desulfomonilaceae bacterium]|nr:hypothetical protein [Desulfomonilaceae bacterium]